MIRILLQPTSLSKRSIITRSAQRHQQQPSLSTSSSSSFLVQSVGDGGCHRRSRIRSRSLSRSRHVVINPTNNTIRSITTTRPCNHPSFVLSSTSPSLRNPNHQLDDYPINNANSNDSINYQFHQYQQIRWKGRKDGNRFSSPDHLLSSRKTSKKQRKVYHQRMSLRNNNNQSNKKQHSAPGSKAGYRREYLRQQQEEILNTDYSNVRDPDTILQERQALYNTSQYGTEDALFDDMMGNSRTQMTPTPIPNYTGHLHTYYYNRIVDQMDDYYSYQQKNNSNVPNTSPVLESSQNPDITNTVLPTTTSGDNMNTSIASTTTIAMAEVELPTDEMISKALRAYRDRYGTSRQPIGIIKALRHLLHDMQLSSTLFGEYTYTTLLTCCASPIEGRRILQMIRDHGLPISDYSYSILCHLYAKQGDYKNCVQVQKEMLENDNLSPTLASYTSLLAACYHVINTTGRISHSTRIDATTVAWEKWQEMRIIGITPDVMSYGAILRIKAASGKAEECINLLQEMHRFQVYPTTFCYTTALRAVARSHSIALRYEKGTSKRHRRRELITQHHGMLTRQIMIMADSSDIVPDDGYISALCLCSGIAGDIATTKAIYIANEIIRTFRNTNLRTIGPQDHLDRLRGVDNNQNNDRLVQQQHRQINMINGGNIDDSYSVISGQEPSVMNSNDYDRYTNGGVDGYNDNTTTMAVYQPNNDMIHHNGNNNNNNYQPNHRYISTYGEREYGKDSRILSSVLYACAQSVHPDGLGMVWQGRENKGYLCSNSLRLIGQIKLPQYTDTSLPGQKITDNLKLVRDEDDRDGYRDGKRRPRKFAGVDVDEKAGSTLDDILGDKELAKRYINPDGRRKFEYRNFTAEEVWRLKYGDDWDKDIRVDENPKTEQLEASSHDNPKGTKGNNSSVKDLTASEKHIVNSYLESVPRDDTTDSEIEVSNSAKNAYEPKRETPVSDIYFDYNTMSWKPKSEQTRNQPGASKHESENNKKSKVEAVSDDSSNLVEEEMYFDNDTMRWKTRPKVNPLTNGDKSSSIKEGIPSATVADKVSPDDDDDDDIFGDSDDNDDNWETLSDTSDDEDEDYYFDKEQKRWLVRSQKHTEDVDHNVAKSNSNTGSVNESIPPIEFNDLDDAADANTESKSSLGGSKKEKSPDKSISTNADDIVTKEDNNHKKEDVLDEQAANEEAFKIFFSELRQESIESGQDDVTEEEARELFEQMKDEYNEIIVMTPDELGLDIDPTKQNKPNNLGSQAIMSSTKSSSEEADFSPQDQLTSLDKSISNNGLAKKIMSDGEISSDSQVVGSFNQSETMMEKFWSNVGDQSMNGHTTQTLTFDPSLANYSNEELDFNGTDSTSQYQSISGYTTQSTTSNSPDAHVRSGERVEVHSRENDIATLSEQRIPSKLSSSYETTKNEFEMFTTNENEDDYRLVRLRELLPGFSERRLLKIIRCYQSNLSDPPLLELVPIVRENMPDYITSTWLKQMASLTANFVVQKAAQDNVINTEILNAVLDLHTSGGSLDKAIEFHQTEFASHNLEPTQYSDRLVLQMLLRNSRFNRALAFKQTVEESGRTLDIKSYGSLIEHCSKRKQLGSAVLLLQECITVNGVPPGEASLSNLRLLCRQAGIDKEIGLENLIGKDPVEWLRHGERELKREYSKKGRRDVQLTRNALVRL